MCMRGYIRYCVLSKDKIRSTFDVAPGVDLCPSLGKERILVTVETDAVVALLGIVGSQCNSLRATSVGVLDIDVVEFGVLSIICHSSGVVVCCRTWKLDWRCDLLKRHC